MLIAEYNITWAYDEESEVFDEEANEMYFDEFAEAVKKRFKNRKFPLCLKAVNSNWRGQTGYAKVESIDALFQKILSFSNDWIEFHSGRGGSLYFRTANHDVPTGFTIYVNRLQDCKGNI